MVESLSISPLNNGGKQLSRWGLGSCTKSLAMNDLNNVIFFFSFGIYFFDSKTLTL